MHAKYARTHHLRLAAAKEAQDYSVSCSADGNDSSANEVIYLNLVDLASRLIHSAVPIGCAQSIGTHP
jgi:hypothetical protein